MKKLPVLLTGILSPIYFYFVFHLTLYSPLFEYSEKLAFIQGIAMYILPSLPGIALAFVLMQNTMKDFFSALIFTALTSLGIFIINAALGIDMAIYTLMTGYTEFSLGEGFLFAVTFSIYAVACAIGSFIAGIITAYRQWRTKRETQLNIERQL